MQRRACGNDGEVQKGRMNERDKEKRREKKPSKLERESTEKVFSSSELLAMALD